MLTPLAPPLRAPPLPPCRTYLGHCGDVVTSFLREAGASKVLFVPWALKDWDKYFANPASIEYDASGQPKDHTGRPQVRAAPPLAARALRARTHSPRHACTMRRQLSRVAPWRVWLAPLRRGG